MCRSWCDGASGSRSSGPNGLGKSTLLKILVERLAADAGTVRWGHEVRVGYFPQDHREVLDDGRRHAARSSCRPCAPGESPTYVRGQLGRVLFSGDDVDKKIGLLSGGEAARLIFALLAVQKPNVLVLDEPTNHLDLEAIHALVDGLKAYSGTVIFVSHDRWFVSELATRIVELTADGPRDFPGTYPEYLARCGDDHLDADAVILKTKAKRARSDDPGASQGQAPATPAGPSWDAKKRARNRLAKLPARRDRVMSEIQIAEARKQEITDLYARSGFFEGAGALEISALEEEQAALGPRLDTLMAEWEELERELAELGSA